MSTVPLERVSFSSSLQALRAAQKSPKGAPPYSLFVNRPLGRILAAAAHTAGLRPNQVTVISAGCSAAALVLLAVAPATWWVGLLVSLGLAVGYALDSADGQLARLQGGGTLTGEWLDHMIDSVKVSTLHVAVLIMAARDLPLPAEEWLLVPLAFGIASAVHFFGMIVVELLTRVQRASRAGSVPPAPPASLRNTVLKLPTDYGVLCLSFLLLGLPSIFLATYTVLAAATVGYLVAVLGKWYGDVRRLDAPAGAR
jgi:phosphatidylglycerophosphate synthase